jgi:hypothetical protein
LDGRIRDVTGEPLTRDLDARLRRVAVDFILPTGPRVDDAVAVAEDLVASGSTGVATVQVAALSRTTSLSDAESLMKAMLAEHGIDLPSAEDEQSEYQTLLVAFGYWNLPIHLFEGPFYVQIPTWEDQGPLDRALVTLLDQRDHVTSPVGRDSIEEEMREVVRAHIAPA